MNKRSIILGMLAATAISSVFAAVDNPQKAVTSVVSSGVSLNQQIASSSLNGTSSASFANNGGQFVISKSGRYFLSTDVIANPVANTAIIYINCSDVVLDLGGKTLTLSSTSGLTACEGIKIASGKNDITICNGTISGSSTLGATTNRLKYGIDFAGVTGAGNGCNNVTLDNVIITGCGTYGVYLGFSDNLIARNVNIQRITSPSTDTAASKYALYMTNCTDGIIADCAFNYTEVASTTASAVVAAGVYMTTCNNINFSNVSASNNRGSGAIASAAIGIYMTASTACLFNNVRAIANQISGGGSQIAVTYPGATTFVPTVGGGSGIAGFWIDGSSTGNIFMNCIANNNSALASSQTCSAYGFRLTASSGQNTFRGCQAHNNSGITAEGFSSDMSSGNTYDNCRADGNNNTVTNSYATVAAFRAVGSRGNAYLNCEASSNAAGFTASSPHASQTTHGIVMRTENYSVIKGSKFSANGTAGQGVTYGVRLAGTCASCMLTGNEILANTGTARYGFRDDCPGTTTMLRSNVAFAHGACYSGGSSTLVNSTTTNFYLTFSQAAGVMNVQNMIKEADIANMNAFEAGTSQWYNFSILAAGISG